MRSTRLVTTVRTIQNDRQIASPGPRTRCRTLRHFNLSLARTTQSNGLSPIVNHSRRVQQIVRILSQHAGGGPIMVNRPNINGATVTRTLTRHVVGNRIPRSLGKQALVSLSVNNLVTKTGCHNRFRRHLHLILGRIASSRKRVVLFVSRLRAIIKTKTARNAVSTNGLLGPVLTQNRLHYVKTAALSRCHGRVRGSTTLRQHFRRICVNRPDTRSAVSVLQKLGRHCRGRRNIGVTSDTLITTTILSSHCVTSHFLPSGTVSLISRTTTGLGVRVASGPTRLRSLSQQLVRLRVRGLSLRTRSRTNATPHATHSHLGHVARRVTSLAAQRRSLKNR